MRPLLAYLMMTLTAAGLGGCAGPDIAALSVLVTDQASGEPIPGAKVVADTPSRDHPLSFETLLGRTGPMLETAFTDDRGRAVVEYASGRPVRIGVLAPGFPLLIENIDQPWLGETSLLGDREGGKQLRARVEPTSRPQ